MSLYLVGKQRGKSHPGMVPLLNPSRICAARRKGKKEKLRILHQLWKRRHIGLKHRSSNLTRSEKEEKHDWNQASTQQVQGQKKHPPTRPKQRGQVHQRTDSAIR